MPEMLLPEEKEQYAELRSMVDEWKRCGERVYPDGTRWIGHTPDRGPEAYLHQLFAPLDEESIGDLEDELSYDFPGSFLRFMQIHNGIELFANHINIYGKRRSWNRTNDVEAAQQPFSILTPNVYERPDDAPKNLLFIGSLGDERKLVCVLPSGQVQRWDKVSSSTKKETYPSVFNFLLIEARKVRRLFDDLGREI
jgi:SMI1-KNR4 cell-wall